MMMLLWFLFFGGAAGAQELVCEAGERLKAAKCVREELRSYELKIKAADVFLPGSLAGLDVIALLELNSTSFKQRSFVTGTLKLRLDLAFDTRCSPQEFTLWEDALWVFGKTGENGTDIASAGYSALAPFGTSLFTVVNANGRTNFASFGKNMA